MEPSENQSLSESRRNLRLTRVLVMFSFASNAAINVLLIAYLARIGGIELVGYWTLLGAVTLAVMMLDFGSVNALTYRIAKYGLESVVPVLHRLVALAALLGVALAIVLFSASMLREAVVQGVVLAALASLLQLVSNWLIAIRMGRQQQYWFNIKTIMRVIVQAIAVVAAFEFGLVITEVFALGLALVLGGLAELAMAYLLTFREFSFRGTSAPLKTLGELVGGFGITDLSQRANQPLSQLLAAQLLGTGAVGVFTVALRIPSVLNQSLNEALKSLLPSLAKMLGNGDREDAIRLLRDSIAIQLTLVIPAGLILFTHAPVIIEIWLGDIDPSIVSAMRIFTAALILDALSAPFHWTAQAAGQANLLGKIGLAVLILVLSLGYFVMTLTGSVIYFALIYAAGQTLRAIGAISICAFRLHLVQPVVKQLGGVAAFAYLSFVVAVNILISLVSASLVSSYAFLMIAGVNAFLMGPLAAVSITKRWI